MTTKKATAATRRRAYEKKRRFTSTPEPSWRRKKIVKSSQGRLFVIQKHAARRLHFDLRLEIGGALVSWAVPKGIPTSRGQKHLAVKVEDHPLDYADFEGNIPPGNYGAGPVMLWDRGLYEVLEKDPAKAIRNGRLSVVLAGEKLRGQWTLVRTRMEADKEQWLLLKGTGGSPAPAPGDDDRSVATGRTLAEIAEADNGAGEKKPRKTRRARTARFDTPTTVKKLPSADPAFTPPMKPHLAAHLPQTGDWTYEIKFDGYRVVAVKEESRVSLYSRNHKDVSAAFPEIRDAVATLPVDRLVIDGEIVALLESGLSSFQLLQNRARASRDRPPIYCYAFDLLNLEGHDTTSLPLGERKEILRDLLDGAGDPLRFSAGIDTDPQTFLSQAKDLGLEGLIAKQSGSPYHPGRRSRCWLKIKLYLRQEFVVGGYTPPKGSRSHFGAILVGFHKNRKLHYVARVGTGFNEQAIKKAYQLFQDIRSDTCPFVNLPAPRKGSFGGGLTAAEMRRCVWLEPKLVCEVKFSEWTGDDSIRHPVFLGFRDDKPPSEVKREKPV